MEQKELETQIGTIEKENKILEAKKVKIVEVEIVDVERAKSRKVVCHVKHPDREESITISSESYLEEKAVVTKGLWYNLDKEGHIQKDSSLATFMEFMKVSNLKELEGKEADTELDGNYLVFKCY